MNKHGFDLDYPDKVEGCALLTPGLGMRFPLGQGPYLLIGEVAGLVSPSSAEGISYAFISAMILSEILGKPHVLRHIDHVHQTYRNRLARMWWKLNAKCLKAGIIFTGSLRRALLQSSLGASRKKTCGKNYPHSCTTPILR